MTHADAAHGNDGEGFQDSRCANDPVETQKEDYAQDVLHAGQVNSNKSSHLGDLWMEKQKDTRQQVTINRVDKGNFPRKPKSSALFDSGTNYGPRNTRPELTPLNWRIGKQGTLLFMIIKVDPVHFNMDSLSSLSNLIVKRLQY